MLDFICLGSGSCGNCYYLFTEQYGILIDLGIGIRSFKKYFRDYGLSFGKVNAILITHDHTDHIKAAGAFSTEFHVPVYATEAVHAGMLRNRFMQKKVGAAERHYFACGDTFTLGPFRISTFKVPHDSSENCGYYVECEGVSFCLMTDAGSLTEDMVRFIPLSDYLVIEANYDAAMLAAGPYPMFLQKRISGLNGHMCNEETARALAENLTLRTKKVWLCHISEENNHPELVRKTVENALAAVQGSLNEAFTLEVLKRKVPSPLYRLT